MDAWSTWAAGVLTGIGAPATATNEDTLFAWSGAESLPRDRMSINNPLDTTQWEPGAVAFNTLSNGRHVWIYPNIETGITATVTTLLNGYYPGIVSHLRNSVPRSDWADCSVELGLWGTGAAWISRYYGAAPGVLEADLTDDDRAKLKAIYDFISNPEYTDFNQGFDQIKALIKALPSAPPADLSALQAGVAALNAKVDMLATSVAAVKARVEKDLA